MFISFFAPNHWFYSQFPPLHCWFPASFFISLLWASWLSVFWTLHLIGWLSRHHLVLFPERWSVFSFRPYFFVSAHLLRCNGLGLRYSPGRDNPLRSVWCCMWGRGPRGNSAACLALSQFSVTSVSILIISVLNSASHRLVISSLLTSFSGVLICSFIWAIFHCLGTSVML